MCAGSTHRLASFDKTDFYLAQRYSPDHFDSWRKTKKLIFQAHTGKYKEERTTLKERELKITSAI